MKPLVQMNDIRLSENPFAKDHAIADVLDTCLNFDILPNRATHPFRFPFDPSQFSMYVSQRALKGEDVYNAKDDLFRYEDALSRLFWQKAQGDDGHIDRRRLCVLGPTGSGKSTFVDFFLRCYCSEKSGHGQEFNRKIIVWFDANAAKDNERLNQSFFTSAQAWIRTACKQKGVEIDDRVSKRRLPKQNVESWVQHALEEISHLATQANSGIEYLVIFIDNMDQCPVKVQERLMTTMENWLEMPTIKIWRLILTMWPTTYATLKNSTMNMMRNWKVLHLGLIQPEHLMENRRQVITNRIARLLSQTKSGMVSTPGMHEDFRSFMEASLRLWSQRLSGSISDPDDSVESESISTHGLIRELCNGDLRREMGLLHAFLTGEGAYRMWQQDRKAAGQPRRHDYEIVESLILGPHEFMINSPDFIGNLFMVGHRQKMPRDLLIGPHMLHFLKENTTIHEYQALCKAMVDLGYAEQNFEHCFYEFRRLGLLHEVASKRSHGVGYETHDTVVRAYHRLLYHEPAYLDCVAPVTAVDDAALAEMQDIYAKRGDFFARKAECTLAFLGCLRRVENAFCQTAKVREASRDDFAHRLELAQFPCLWKELALRYRRRLIGLRGSGYLAHLPEEWWNEIIGKPIFTEASVARPKLAAM